MGRCDVLEPPSRQRSVQPASPNRRCRTTSAEASDTTRPQCPTRTRKGVTQAPVLPPAVGERVVRQRASANAHATKVLVQHLSRLHRNGVGLDLSLWQLENFEENQDVRRTDDLRLLARWMIESERRSPATDQEIEERVDGWRERNEFVEAALELRALAYVVLLNAVLLAHEQPKLSAPARLERMVDFLDNNVYTLALLYFHISAIGLGSAPRRFFKGLMTPSDQKRRPWAGEGGIQSDCRNVSWDMYHLQLAEMAFIPDPDDSAVINIPTLLTFDRGLSEIADTLPLSALIVRPIPHMPIAFRPGAKESAKHLEGMLHPDRIQRRELVRPSVDLADVRLGLEERASVVLR